jgi:hypothetical protein
MGQEELCSKKVTDDGKVVRPCRRSAMREGMCLRHFKSKRRKSKRLSKRVIAEHATRLVRDRKKAARRKKRERNP